MTTIVMTRNVNDDGSIELKSYSDTLLSSGSAFTAVVPKVFRGVNYLIGFAGNAYAKEVIEAWTEKHNDAPVTSKLATFEWMKSLCDFLKEHKVMDHRGGNKVGCNTVLVTTALGVYEISHCEPVLLGDVSSVGTGSRFFDSLNAIRSEASLSNGSDNPIHEASVEDMVRMAISADPKSDGFEVSSILLYPSGKPASLPAPTVSFVVELVDVEESKPYVLEIGYTFKGEVTRLMSTLSSVNTDKLTVLPSSLYDTGSLANKTYRLDNVAALTQCLNELEKSYQSTRPVGKLITTLLLEPNLFNK